MEQRVRCTQPLEQYVLIEATRDHMVYPHESETHGFWDWNTTKNPKKMRDTQAYSEDWIGLKTLDEAGKIKEFTYAGEHGEMLCDEDQM